MSAPPDPHSGNAPDWTRPRPIDASYWVWPGRLLVGEHPGARSRAQSLERVRRFLDAGVTCFIDLTEPGEIASYEKLLPAGTPAGHPVEYRREPIPDHGVPGDTATMARILDTIDDALDAGHCVYVHCRAGIGRSATAAGCWLAERNPERGRGALIELSDLWQQSARSLHWPSVPETDAQIDYVRTWQPRVRQRAGTGRLAGRAGRALGGGASLNIDLAARVRGAWHGMAAGEALCREPSGAGRRLAWGQQTALALCLSDSLARLGRCDARDQIERYWRWLKEGHRAATGEPGEAIATADVARALAHWRWRGQAMAGPHDPKDAAPNSLPRVLAAVLHAGDDVAGGIALGAECSRTTHQSPLILDACRLYAAMLAGALHGQDAAAVLQGVPEPAAGCYGARPLRKDVRAACVSPPVGIATSLPSVLRALVLARRIVGDAASFDAAIGAARSVDAESAGLIPALAGTLYGALHGIDSLPDATLDLLAGRDQLEEVSRRSLADVPAPGVPQ